MNIRPAVPADLRSLALLEREIFGDEAYPAAFFRQAAELWPGWLLVAPDPAPGPGGYALAAPATTDGEAWVLALATRPAARGRGLGTALFGALLGTLRTGGICTVRLTVHPDNPARRLYERHGFAVESLDPAYFGAGEPRLLMRLRFRGPDLSATGSCRRASPPGNRRTCRG